MKRRKTQRGVATFVVLAILGTLLLSGGVLFVLTNKYSVSNQQTDNEDENTQLAQELPAVEEETVALVKSALAGEGSAVCTFTYENHEGTAYIGSDDRFRVDTDTSKGLVHVIKRDSSAYVWTDNQEHGIVYSGETYQQQFDEQFNSFNPDTLSAHAETYDIGKLACERKDFDDELFVLPTNVNFNTLQDLNNVVPQ